MNKDDMIELIPSFLLSPGKYSDVVLFTKVQLRRNIREFLFVPKADDEERKEILSSIRAMYSNINGFEYSGLQTMDAGMRILLREKFILPSSATNDPFFKGMFYTERLDRVIIIGDQDHVKLISFMQGLSPSEAYTSIEELDIMLSREMGVAFDKDFGYLTASPHFAGTGLTISAYVHLPGLVVTDRLRDVKDKTLRSNAGIRPVYETGGKVPGALFIIENTKTLNLSEEEIIANMTELVQDAVKLEYEARSFLMEKARIEIEDRIWRAYGVLRYARCLDVEEFLNLISAIRMGAGYGIIKCMDTEELNRLHIVCQPEHIRTLIDLTSEETDESTKRAELVHSALGG